MVGGGDGAGEEREARYLLWRWDIVISLGPGRWSRRSAPCPIPTRMSEEFRVLIISLVNEERTYNRSVPGRNFQASPLPGRINLGAA